MKKTTLLSIGLLIAFFLPWVDLNLITISGYEIPTSLDKLSNLNNLLNDGSESSLIKVSYILYIIPILSIINIVNELSKKKRAFINEFQFGIIAVFFIFIIAKQYSEESASFFSVGYYLTALFSLLGFLICLFQKNEDLLYPLNDSNLSNPSKTHLLNQLEKLHSLNEKKILNDEIYQQEKNDILEKLKRKDSIPLNSKREDDEESTNFILEKLQNKKTLILSFVGILLFVFGGFAYMKSNHTYEQKIIGIWKIGGKPFIEFKKDSVMTIVNDYGKFDENSKNGKYAISEKNNELMLSWPVNEYENDVNYFTIKKFDENVIILKNENKDEGDLILEKQLK